MTDKLYAPMPEPDYVWTYDNARHVGYSEEQMSEHADATHALREAQLPAVPTIDEIMRLVRESQHKRANEANNHAVRAAIEAAIREARDAAKDCRTCIQIGYEMDFMNDTYEMKCMSEKTCAQWDQYLPATQPVRLWEK